MRNREKSAYLSAFGKIFEILKVLIDEVKALGGNDSHWDRILTDKKLRQQIAELIAGSGRQLFTVVVDYGQPLAEMIAMGKYDFANSDINADHFPVSGEGQQEVAVELFHFNKSISSEKAIAEMDAVGYRPAILPELLALGASQPELQRQFPIVALGSVWQGPDGSRSVACLYRSYAERSLYLRWFGYGWNDVYRFAAVRK